MEKLIKNTSFYSFGTILQKGIGFFLLPLYTRYLMPEDYGILAVVSSISSVVAILFTFSLNSAIARFYVDYYKDIDTLRKYLGSVLIFIALSSITFCILLLLYGDFVFGYILEGISFYPFLVVAIISLVFQPIFGITLTLLQMREEAKKYMILRLFYTVINVSMAIFFVVFRGSGAIGVLVAGLISNVILGLVALYIIKGLWSFSFQWIYVKNSLKYSIPIIPHQLSAFVMTLSDRILINKIINAASTGLYSIGISLCSPLNIITTAVNTAYAPIYLKKRSEGNLDGLRSLTLRMAAFYNSLALVISFFSFELIYIFLDHKYLASSRVIPFIAIGYIAQGYYYIFVNAIFYNKTATKYVSLITISGGAVNVGLNLLLIGRLGILGAALATLISQILTAVLAGFLGKRYEKVEFDYKRMILIFIWTSIFVMLSIFITDLQLQFTLQVFLKIVLVSINLFTIIFYLNLDLIQIFQNFKFLKESNRNKNI